MPLYLPIRREGRDSVPFNVAYRSADLAEQAIARDLASPPDGEGNGDIYCREDYSIHILEVDPPTPHKGQPVTSPPPRLLATFRPQTWIDDYAVDVDGAVEFDATDAFLALPLEQIREFKEHHYDSDHLADDLPARGDHSGPFEVDTHIDEWLEACGFAGGRASLTPADLDRLRAMFPNPEPAPSAPESSPSAAHRVFLVGCRDGALLCYLDDGLVVGFDEGPVSVVEAAATTLADRLGVAVERLTPPILPCADPDSDIRCPFGNLNWGWDDVTDWLRRDILTQSAQQPDTINLAVDRFRRHIADPPTTPSSAPTGTTGRPATANPCGCNPVR